MSLRLPSSRPRLRRPALIALSAALIGSLVLAGCGGAGKKADGSERPQSQPTEGGTELAAVWPLTGLPAPQTSPDHPVMVVKIDNSSASYPQYGLGSADLVVEELVEGGYSRLAVAFYSKLPSVAGPVRSARASDIGIVLPTHAALIASGAAPPTKRRLSRAGVHFYEYGVPGTYRDASEHDQLHSEFVKLGVFAKSLKKAPVVPASYFPWGKEADFAGVQPVKKITVRFSSHTSSTFDWTGKRYINTDGYTKKGDGFQADSVLVLRVRTGNAGYLDPAGNRVPETFFFGKGAAFLFHDGQLIRGTWTKESRSAPLQLQTAAGPLTIPPGKVRMELLPRTEPGVGLTFK